MWSLSNKKIVKGHIFGGRLALAAGLALTVCAAAVLAGGCASADANAGAAGDLVSIGDLTGQAASSGYKTAVCEYGTIEQDASTKARVAYPKVYNVYFLGDEKQVSQASVAGAAQVAQVNARNGAVVKKGDVLATFTYGSQAAQTQQQQLTIQINSLTNDISAQKDQMQKQIDSIEEQINSAYMSAGGARQAEILNVNEQKAQEDLDYYTYTSGLQLQALNDQLTDVTNAIAGIGVAAPADGVVGGLGVLMQGQEVQIGTLLMNITPQEDFLLALPSGSLSSYWYGLPVEVSADDGSVGLKGTVVSDAAMLYADAPGAQAGDFGSNSVITVTTTGCAYGPVLIVPNTAIFSEDKKQYVQILGSDGSLRKRYVQTGLADKDNVQIITGVDEGQTVVLGK